MFVRFLRGPATVPITKVLLVGGRISRLVAFSAIDWVFRGLVFPNGNTTSFLFCLSLLVVVLAFVGCGRKWRLRYMYRYGFRE